MKKLVLYGAGKIGQKWIEKIGSENVYAFADSTPEKSKSLIYEKFNKQVLSINEAFDLKDNIQIFITASYSNRLQIIQQLKSCGLDDVIIYSPYNESVLRCQPSSFFDSITEFEGYNYLEGNSVVTQSKIGICSYIANQTTLCNAVIGRFCSIGCNVSIIAGKHPTTRWVSTHPSFFSAHNPVTYLHFTETDLFNEREFLPDGYSIYIGNDVWIGADVKLKEGIKIGDGAIIAAGAIVTKDVEPYTIVGGVPAKKIRDRFELDQKNFLSQLQWWNKDLKWIENHATYFKDIKLLMDYLHE